MKNIIFVFFMLFFNALIPLLFVSGYFSKLSVSNKKLFNIIVCMCSLFLFFVFSPILFFVFIAETMVILNLLMVNELDKDLSMLNVLYSPEIVSYNGEIEKLREELDKVFSQNRFLEEELNRKKELFRLIEEINEHIELDKIFLEFYRIVKHKFSDEIFHMFLIKSKKKDVLEVISLPQNSDVLSSEIIKNKYFKRVSRSELKNHISYNIFANNYEYYIVIEFSQSSSKEKIVPQLNFLFEETRAAFQRAVLYKEVEELSRIDGLTGLYLRRYFGLRLETEFLRAAREKSSFSFMIFDIDHFKKINDTYGHLCGDKILKEVAKMLRESIGDAGMISRWGGEEFLIFLPYHNKKEAVDIAEKIRVSIERKKFEVDNVSLEITLSCGVSSFHEDADKLDELIRIADSRLYKSKVLGRNRASAD